MLNVIEIDNCIVDVISDDRFSSDGFIYFLESNEVNESVCLRNGVFIITHSSIMDAYIFLSAHVESFNHYENVILVCSLPVWNILGNVNDKRFKFIDIHSSLDVVLRRVKKSLVVNDLQVVPRGVRESLTRSEIRFMSYYMKGYSATSISRILGVSIKTISAYKRAVMRKYSVSSTIALLMKDTFSERTKSLCNDSVMSCD